jgi:antitoxin HicB
MSVKNMGSNIDDFLKRENIFEEAQAQAIKEVVAWQLAKAMKKKKISKARMAVLLKTSRSQVDRILDLKRDITLSRLAAGGGFGWSAGHDRVGLTVLRHPTSRKARDVGHPAETAQRLPAQEH